MSIKEFAAKIKAPILWGNLLAMLVVIVLLCFGVMWWLNSYTHHGEGIEVPNLYGVTHKEAVLRLDSVGLVVVANDSSYVERSPSSSRLRGGSARLSSIQPYYQLILCAGPNG